MQSLPSNFQTIINTKTEKKTFEEKWPLIGTLLGMQSQLDDNKASIMFFKDDIPIITINKAGGCDIFVNGDDEFIKKLLIACIKEHSRCK